MTCNCKNKRFCKRRCRKLKTKCPEPGCTKILSSSCMAVHIKTRHQFICSKCNFVTRRKMYLYEHYQSHFDENTSDKDDKWFFRRQQNGVISLPVAYMYDVFLYEVSLPVTEGSVIVKNFNNFINFTGCRDYGPYISRLNGETKVPDFVAEYINYNELYGNDCKYDRSRCNVYNESFDLDKQAKGIDYGYVYEKRIHQSTGDIERGHMASIQNHNCNPRHLAITNCYSNIMPVHHQINHGIMHRIEDYVPKLVRSHYAVLVLTAPIYEGEPVFLGPRKQLRKPSEIGKLVIWREYEPPFELKCLSWAIPNQQKTTSTATSCIVTVEQFSRKTKLFLNLDALNSGMLPINEDFLRVVRMSTGDAPEDEDSSTSIKSPTSVIVSPAIEEKQPQVSNSWFKLPPVLVGQEFIRQYYTVLNEGPHNLYRFYLDDSLLVHAEDSKVCYGQQEIHKRIQSLNFHNCHAKILHVDSQETLGSGVVIQVTGELSKNGQPMRRFVQTFVLAPQNPKQYYVRNDIFHYQDEIFRDDDAEPDIPPQSTPMYTEDVEENEQEVDINGGNGIIKINSKSTTVTVPKLSPSGSVTFPTLSASGSSPNNMVVHTVEEKVPGKSTIDSSTSIKSAPNVVVPPVTEEKQAQVNTNNSGPKTYANLFKSGSSTFSKPNKLATEYKISAVTGKSTAGSNGPAGCSLGNAQVTVNVNDGLTSPPQVSLLPSTAGVNKGLPPRKSSRNQAYNRDRVGDRDRPGGDRDGYPNLRERLMSRSSTTLNDEAGNVDGDRRRPVNTYPDANQLFVGNLPHFTTVQDMKEIFVEFGEVAEVKIQKPAHKQVKVPYFCFVVFEEAHAAQQAIERKGGIVMKLHGGGQRRLNVEPKRSQRSGRVGADDSDASYNRMDVTSTAKRSPYLLRSQSWTLRDSSNTGGSMSVSGEPDPERGGNGSRVRISEKGNIGRDGVSGRNGGGREI